MKKMILTIAAAGFLAGSTTMAFAEGRIQKRKENQQDRIASGIKNGTLSPREAANLEHKEARVNHEIRDDREDHGGHLTNRDKVQINRQQNRLSRNIYKDKHN